MSRPTLTTEQYRTAYYELGWDCGRHELHLTFQQLTSLMEHRERFMQGFREATTHFRGRYLPYDLFELKVLRLRLNALKRKRIILDDVNADYLRSIAQLRCPVTLKPIAFFKEHAADLYPSDEVLRQKMIWSIDRVDNRGGYERGNLMIISAMANVAKGDLRLSDIIGISHDLRCQPDTACAYGLGYLDWCRLSYLFSSMSSQLDWREHTLLPAQTFWGHGQSYCFPLEALKYGFVTNLIHEGRGGSPFIGRLLKSIFLGKTGKVAERFSQDVSARLYLSPFSSSVQISNMHERELAQLRFSWLWSDPYAMDRWKHLVQRITDADVDRVRHCSKHLIGLKQLNQKGFESDIGMKYSARDDDGYFTVSDESIS